MSFKIDRREMLKLTSSFLLAPPSSWSVLPGKSQPLNSTLAALERRVPITLVGAQGPRTSEGDLFLRPGETIPVVVDAPGPLTDLTWRLRLVGELDVDPQLHRELRLDALYRVVDDALDWNTTHHRTCSLALRPHSEAFPCRAYWRTLWASDTEEGERSFTIWAKKQEVEILPGGKVGVQVEVYRQRPGRNQGDISGPADATHFLDLGQGTSDWTKIQLPVDVSPDVACILFTIIGEAFRGKVWLEDPQFPGLEGVNSLPPFAPARPFAPFRNWLGQNLSKLEWPDFRLSINGQELFRGAVFQPLYRWPAWEVDVPPGVLKSGPNELEIELVSDHKDATGYMLRRLEWLGTPNGLVEVLACPKLTDAGKEFTVLVSTREPNQRLSVDVLRAETGLVTSIKPITQEVSLQEAGLHFVRFGAGAAGAGGTLRFRLGNVERSATVERVVERTDDNILLGSSESYFIPVKTEDFRRFFTWYLNHEGGNAMWFDVVYIWGGMRVCEPQAWREALRLCEGAGIKYAYGVDGRDINGVSANPTDEMLSGPLFLGSLTQEQDCYFYYIEGEYSIRRPGEELFWDVFFRYPARSRVYLCNPSLLGGETLEPLFFNPNLTDDMREGAEYFVSNVRANIGLGTRNFGASTLFKYLFQAGYKWLDAELIGSHEIVLGALRGASLAYDRPGYGALLPIEWRSGPHDDPAFFRRYFLSLATCYLHGVEQITLQNGLYHMETPFVGEDRFSAACQGTQKVHAAFYRFVRSHSRRGRMRVPVGFLHGQYDGWTCVDRDTEKGLCNLWGQNGRSTMAFGAPEKSWDLLKTFFPRSVLGPIRLFPCPHESVGFFTGTPYGPASIVPVEAPTSALQAYRALIMLGWNTADAGQIERLLEYVEQGGHLVLGLPHLSTETRRNQLPAPLESPTVQTLLGLELGGFTVSSGEFSAPHALDNTLADAVRGKTVQLKQVRLREAVPRLVDRKGTPLLVENRVGRGRVTWVNGTMYPGDPSLRKLYEQLVRSVGEETVEEQRQNVWVSGSEDVSFAVYDWEQTASGSPTKTIYLLNVNWWSDPAQAGEASLLWKEAKIPLSVRRDRIHVITISNDWGFWTDDGETDVMEIRAESKRARIRLQGQGKTTAAILYRPAAAAAASPKLLARSSTGLMRIQLGPTPGLWWMPELVLNGVEQIEFLIAG